MKYTIKLLPLTDLDPSETNPRKKFSIEKLEELAASIREQGVLIPLLVRPAGSRYEIVAGERRFRAATASGLQKVPCHIREMADSEVLEAQMIENLQRDDLDPLEEAAGFRRMLDLRGADGEEIYSSECLAEKLGKSPRYVQRRLKLLHLPEAAIKALSDGLISVSTSELIARIPDKTLREKAAKEVISPKYYEGSLTYRETQTLIERSYMRSLEGSSFDQEDAGLHPKGIKCSLCPHRGGNSPDTEGVRSNMCLDPVCFENKSKLAYERWKQKHEGEGRRVLTAAENSKHIAEDRIVAWSSNLVALDEAPQSHLLNTNSSGKQILPWRQLSEERGLEVVIARMSDGSALECADREAATAAARLNGHHIFRGENVDDRKSYEEEQKRERAERQERGELFIALLAAVPGKAGEDTVPWMRELIVLCMEQHLAPLLAARGLSAGRKLVDEVIKAEPAALCDLAAQVLLAAGVDHDNELTSHGKRVLKRLGVSPAKVRKEMIAKKGAAAAGKKKKKENMKDS